MRMHVRPFCFQDAPALARIFYAAVHRIAGLHYSVEQLNAWAPIVPSPDRFVERGTDGRVFLVAVDNSDQQVAYGDVEADGHIDHLFCRPDVAGTGITSILYDHMEAAAKDRGISRLYVEASEPAQRFFLRNNFTVLQRRDFNLGDVPIHNFAMEKLLDA